MNETPTRIPRTQNSYECFCENCKAYFRSRVRTAKACKPACRHKLWEKEQIEKRKQLAGESPLSISQVEYTAENERVMILESRRKDVETKLGNARELYARTPSPGLANNIFILNKRLEEFNNRKT